jgi:hypothetical protein
MRLWKRTGLRCLALVAGPLAVSCADQPVAPSAGWPVVPAFSDVSGRPDCPSCANVPHGVQGGSHLLASWPGGQGGTTLTTNPTLPAGVTLCVLHAAGNPFDGLDLSKPYPAAIPSSDVVGCDRVFLPESSYVIDFDAANTPGFAGFAARLADGANDIVWNVTALVDGSLNNLLVTGGVSIDEHSLTSRTINGGASTGGFTGADFAGFTVDFVRLRVSDIAVSLAPQGGAYYVSYHWSLAWEFWGRIAPAAAVGVPG